MEDDNLPWLATLTAGINVCRERLIGARNQTTDPAASIAGYKTRASNGGAKSGASNSSTQMSGSNLTWRAM